MNEPWLPTFHADPMLLQPRKFGLASTNDGSAYAANAMARYFAIFEKKIDFIFLVFFGQFAALRWRSHQFIHHDRLVQLVKSIPEEQHWIAAPSHSIPDYYQCTNFLINIRISYPGISYYFRQQRSPFIMLTLLLLVVCSYHQPCVASSPSEVLAAFSR